MYYIPHPTMFYWRFTMLNVLIFFYSFRLLEIHPWNICGLSWARTTASVWPAIDLWSSVFARLSAHMPSLCLSFTGGDKAFCPGGGGWLKSSAWCEGGVRAFCAACLVILWHHLSTSKPSSGDVLAHLSGLTVWISFWYICTSAVENVSLFILLI